MVKLFRWLLGYVDFVFKKGFTEGFINDCFSGNLNVHNLHKDGDILKGQCSAGVYKKLHRTALKNGGIIEIKKKHGPIFAFLKFKNRWGIFVGIVCFIFIINFLSGFIWNIEIVGNNRIKDKDIMDFLAENSFSVGSHWNSTDKDMLENLMMASFDDCAWVHINEFGSTARVEINETVEKPDIVDDNYITNLKASKDGIIVKATVYDGWKTANVGDSVTQGDILISGVYESEKKKKNFFAHARGEYIAQVNEPFNLTVSRQQSKKVYLDSKKYKTINFFGINIPLYIGKKDYINSDIEIKSDNITAMGKKLPIGITTKTVKRYSVKTVVLNDKDLNKIIKKEITEKLNKDFTDCEIIKKDISISLNSDEAKAKGTVVCLENIGVESKISEKR